MVSKFNSGTSLSKILELYSIKIKYSEPFLLQYRSLDITDNELCDYLSHISLFCFVEWVAQFERSQKPSAYDPILISLLFSAKSKFGDIAIESFIITIDISLSDKSFMFPLPYPNLINSFLEISHSTQFIKLFIKQLITRGSISTDPYFSQFLTSVLKIIYNNSDAFNQDDAENIVLQLSTFIIQYQPPALALFGAISVFISDNLLNSMVLSMVSCIKEIMLHDPLIKIEITPDEKSKLHYVKINDSLTKPTIDLNFSETETFPNGFSNRNNSFPDCEKLSNFIGTKASEYLSLIADSFYSNQKLSSLFINIFLKNIKPTKKDDQNLYKNNDCLNLVSGAFLLNEKILNLGVKTTINYKAIQYLSPIYDPCFSLFDYTKEKDDENKQMNTKYYYIFNTLRQNALEITRKNNFNAFCAIIGLVSSYPLLLDEILSSILTNSEDFFEKFHENPAIIRMLLRISYHYQKANFSGYETEIIEIVRSRLFQFFTFFLSQNSSEVTKFIFTDVESTEIFISFVREKKMEQFILQTISQYASNSNAKDVTILMNSVFKMIKIYIKDFDSFDKIKVFALLTNLINTVNLISVHRAKYQSNMIPEICQLLCSLSIQLEPNKESKNLVRELIMFMTAMTNSYIIREKELKLLFSVLMKFKSNDNEFVKTVYANLVQFLGGEFMPTISSTFIIRQPQVIKLMIQVYLDNDKFADVANLFISLCHFSFKNVQICYQNKIDVFILECIEEARIESPYDSNAIKLLLSLFFLISSYKTDVKTVLKYISLFKPIDENHHVSKYQPVFLDTMKTIIDESSKGPLKYLPLNGEIVTSSQTEFPGIEHGFTFTAWIHVEHNGPDYQPHLFTIYIGKGLRVNLSMSGNICLSVIDDSNKEVTGKMMDQLPTGQWIFFAYSISFKQQEAMAQVNFFINMEEAGSFKVKDLTYDFSSVKINLKVGGGTVPSSTNIGKVASASFSPILTQEQLRSIYENGICRFVPQFSFQIYEFFLSFNPHGVYSITAFIRKLIKQCSINVFFPLLEDSTVTFSDGSPFTGQFDQILQLFISFLPFSFDLQRNFCSNFGPAILGYLIHSRWTQHFSYKNYIMFYQLLENIKYEDLRIQIFRFVLVNFDILCHIEGEFHMRILRHWEQTLYSTFGTLSKNVYSFRYLFSVLRLYYWYEPIENEAFNKTSRKEFNIDFCRKRIENVIAKYVEEDGLNYDELLTIMSHIIDCKDEKQSIDLMNFLISLIYSLHEQFTFKFEAIDFMPYLTSFFLIQNKEINILSVSLIVALKSNNLISEKYLLDFIHGLILILPIDSEFPYKEIFNCYFEMKKDCSSLYPLCCILAMKLKEEFLEKMISDLKVEYGWIWPSTLTISSNADQKKRIFKFLINSSDEQRWLGIYTFLDMLYLEKETNEEVKNIFLSTLCDCILEKSVQTSSSFFGFLYKYTEFFILFRKDSFVQTSPNYKENFIYREWNKILTKIKQEKLIYKFGIRIDSDGKWKDFELAKKVISIYIKNRMNENLNFILLLISYIHQYSQESISDYTTSLQLTKENVDKIMKENSNEAKFFTFFGKNRIETFINTEYSDFFSRYTSLSNKFSSSAQHREKTALNKVTPDLEKIGLISQLQVNSFSKSHNLSVIEQEKLWNSLLFHVTSHCGPWEKEIEFSNEYVRDFNSCFSHVPVKISQSFQITNYETHSKKNTSKVVLEIPCTIVTFDDELEALFEMTNESIKFRIQILRSIIFPLSIITVINLNRITSTLQLFTITGTNIYAKFSIDDLSVVSEYLDKAKELMSNLIYFLNEEPFTTFNSDEFKRFCTKRWSMRKMSNYEYLLALNFIDGRSFNSPERYPIFPCLFNSEGKTRKDLSKTVSGAPRYTDDNLPITKESVFRFFEKFTKKVDDSPKKPLEETAESVPEVYTMPELSSPEVSYTNRKVLESDEVTVNLHRWISLIWSSECISSISPENGFMPLFHGSHASRSKSKTWSFLSRKIGAVSIIHDGEIDETILSSSLCSAMIHENGPREYIVSMLVLQNAEEISQQKQLGIFVETTIVNESRKTFSMKNITLNLPEFFQTLNSPSSSSQLISQSSSSLFSTSSAPSLFSSASSSANSSTQNLLSANIAVNGELEANSKTNSIHYCSGLSQFLVTTSYKTSYSSMSAVFSVNVASLIKSEILPNFNQGDFFRALQESQLQKQQQQQQQLVNKKAQMQQQNHNQNGKEMKQSQLMLKRKTVAITAISSDGQFVVVGFESSMVIVFMNWKPIIRVLLYRDSITSCAVSEYFHIFVCAMKDNSIAICSLVDGTVVKLIDLSSQIVKKIIISPSWGFINVYSTEIVNGDEKNVLSLFSVNGKFIRKTDIEFNVDFWYAWKSYCGFDFLAIADENGSVYCCENFYINSVQKLLSTNGNIIAFYYSNETSTLVAALSNGQLFMIPFTA